MWVSPYRRTRETAEVICRYVTPGTIKEDDMLAELQFGIFDGLSDDEAASAFPAESFTPGSQKGKARSIAQSVKSCSLIRCTGTSPEAARIPSSLLGMVQLLKSCGRSSSTTLMSGMRLNRTPEIVASCTSSWTTSFYFHDIALGSSYAGFSHRGLVGNLLFSHIHFL